MGKATGVGVAGLVAMGLVVFGLMFYSIFWPPPKCDEFASNPAAVVDVSKIPSSVGVWKRGQLEIAAVVLNAAASMGLGSRGQLVGLAVAMGESSLVNIDYGDAAGPDSRGIFQQRANGAWGSYADRMNPSVASQNFFKALQRLSGWESMSVSEAGHRVQRNADPNHYVKYEAAARQVIDAFVAAGAMAGGSGPSSDVLAGGGRDYGALGGVKPFVRKVANVVGNKFGINTIYGVSSGGGLPYHPEGRALDFMTYTDLAKGDRIMEWINANVAQIKPNHVCWRNYLYTYRGGAVQMRTGGCKGNHMNHVHIAWDMAQALSDGDVAAGGSGLCVAGGGGLTERPPNERAATAVRFALSKVNRSDVVYRFGATGPNNFDCSGLTVAAWREAGISIPRTSQAQQAGLPKVDCTKAAPGDLLIVDGGGHVGIYVGDGKIAEFYSSGKPGRIADKQNWVSRRGAVCVRPGV